MRDRRDSVIFRDRRHAGQVLAHRLGLLAGCPNTLVLGLPRGGVPVAYEVAQGIAAPLDVLLVRKLGVPGQEELAMGAVAPGGHIVLNGDVVRHLRIGQPVIDAVARDELAELNRRERLYRGGRPRPAVKDQTVILVDDGLATGSTMRAAAQVLKQQGPERLIVAVPVAAQSTCDALAAEVDEVICVSTPDPFHAVGLWYENFSQTTDEEVQHLLTEAAERTAGWCQR